MVSFILSFLNGDWFCSGVFQGAERVGDSTGCGEQHAPSAEAGSSGFSGVWFLSAMFPLRLLPPSVFPPPLGPCCSLHLWTLTPSAWLWLFQVGPSWSSRAGAPPPSLLADCCSAFELCGQAEAFALRFTHTPSSDAGAAITFSSWPGSGGWEVGQRISFSGDFSLSLLRASGLTSGRWGWGPGLKWHTSCPWPFPFLRVFTAGLGVSRGCHSSSRSSSWCCAFSPSSCGCSCPCFPTAGQQALPLHRPAARPDRELAGEELPFRGVLWGCRLHLGLWEGPPSSRLWSSWE